LVVPAAELARCGDVALLRLRYQRIEDAGNSALTLVQLMREALSREAPLGVPRICAGGVTQGRGRSRR
jgi:hypothetical protein